MRQCVITISILTRLSGVALKENLSLTCYCKIVSSSLNLNKKKPLKTISLVPYFISEQHMVLICSLYLAVMKLLPLGKIAILQRNWLLVRLHQFSWYVNIIFVRFFVYLFSVIGVGNTYCVIFQGFGSLFLLLSSGVYVWVFNIKIRTMHEVSHAYDFFSHSEPKLSLASSFDG